MPAVTAADASGDDGSGTQRRAPEETLNRFVRYVAFLEWVGNAFGLLSFTWATVVLLNGYTSLNNDDLWFATVIIFIEAFRYAAASVLQNLCAHCGAKLMSHPDASNHLSSTLTTVMEHIMEAEGKQLESLIGLATQIGDVIREPFVRQVESQPNTGAELVQKLVCTLNSSKIPNPEHPRMRRIIVKIVITILRSCHHTVEKLMEEGMMEGLMEALTKIDRTPSKVENYRVFYGNKGVVLENEEPMTTLVARAKALIRRTIPTAGTTRNGR